MKIRPIIRYASIVGALAAMPFLAQSVQAGPVPILGQVNIQIGKPKPEYRPHWSDDQQKELRHIYYRLEHADRDYAGHRDSALREIRTAAEEMGMDLHGAGYAQEWQGTRSYGGYGEQAERQEWSQDALRRSHDRLKELANSTEDPVRGHLLDAVHELDMALEVH